MKTKVLWLYNHLFCGKYSFLFYSLTQIPHIIQGVSRALSSVLWVGFLGYCREPGIFIPQSGTWVTTLDSILTQSISLFAMSNKYSHNTATLHLISVSNFNISKTDFFIPPLIQIYFLDKIFHLWKEHHHSSTLKPNQEVIFDFSNFFFHSWHPIHIISYQFLSKICSTYFYFFSYSPHPRSKPQPHVT